MEEPKSKGLLHVAEKAKAMMALMDYSGVVTWVGDDRFCLFDSIGLEICCWTTEALILSGLLEKGTSVSNKTEAEHVLKCIIQKLHEIHQKRVRESKDKN